MDATASQGRSRPALATWLFAGAMGATIAAVLTCTLVIDRFVRDEDRRQATTYLQAHADALRDALDRGMAHHYEEVNVIAHLDQVARSSDPQAVRRALDSVHSSFPQFTWLGLTDTQGVVIASVDGLLQGVNVSARPWFSGAQRGSFVGDVHRAVMLEKLLPAQSEPWRFVDVAIPVHGADGELRGILGAHLSWTWAAQMKRELVDRVIEQHRAEALVLAADGSVLLGALPLQGKKLEAVPDTLAVQSQTRGAGRYPGLGWKVVLRQPEAVAMAEFHVLQSRMVFAAVALCAFLAPLLWLLARRLAAPMWQLTERLEGEGAAEPARSRQNPLYREADLLGEALDRYATRQAQDAGHLRELNATLEARVAERTAALAHSEQRLRTITDNLPVLIAYVDKEERYQFCNGTYQSWLGVDARNVVGRLVPETLNGRDYAARKDMLHKALAGERTEFELATIIQGAERQLHTTYLPDMSPQGAVLGVYALAIDITDTKTAQQQLLMMVRTDTLTGLPNRRHFNEKLVESLARSRRRKQPIALLFLDIDKFKSINDQLGHAAGDEVLQIFAQRLQGSVRETDTVARLAGDEFVVILEDLHTPAEPQFVARKILAAINRPFELPSGALIVGSSIGIAYQADGHSQPEPLLATADKALYEAKASGRNTYRMAGL